MSSRARSAIALAATVLAACAPTEEAVAPRSSPPPLAPAAPTASARASSAPATAASATSPAPAPSSSATTASRPAPPEPEPEPTAAPSPRPPGPPVRLPGPCVDTEKHALRLADQRSGGGDKKASPGLEADFVEVRQTPDLDGDGAPDQIRFGGATGMNILLFLYVMRGKCGHHVGTIDANVLLRPLTTWHRGMLDVGGPEGCPIDCCPEDTVRTWAFDGVRYALADTRTTKATCSSFP